jgi:hypothetical protein
VEIDFFKCAKCEGRMTKGFMIDSDRRQSLDSVFYYMYWIEGEPRHEDALFGGKMSSLDVDNRKKYVVMASRCTKCGYLDLYAV